MDNQGGVVHLGKIYDFLKDLPARHESYIIKKGEFGGRYAAVCDTLTDPDVPKTPGFYLWGFYDRSKFWVNVYLGKAGNDAKGKFAHLRWRVREELMDERAFAWRAFTREKKDTVQLDYPRYTREVLRAINKAGSTHIFWVAVPNLKAENIRPVENDLIETLNPTGNGERNPPSPIFRPEATQILDAFREMIHLPSNRNSVYPLDYHRQFWKWVGETPPAAP